MPYPLQVNKAVVSLTSTAPSQFVAPFAKAYLTVKFTVVVVKLYIFKQFSAATIAKELDDEISICRVLSASVKLYKEDIDDEFIYIICMLVLGKVAKPKLG